MIVGMDEQTKLLLDAADGDRDALARFVTRSQAEVWRFMAHLVDPDSADDLTQEVFLRAMRAASRFRGEASARTWLLTIARRTAADEIRQRQRSRRLHDAVDHDRPPPAPDHAGELALHELIARLDEDRRTAFVLTQVLGLTYLDAAVTCEVAVGTIRSRVWRARRDLVAMFDTDERGGTAQA